MKKMKRVLVALLSCLTAFACLAGTVACGEDKKANSSSNNTASESVADTSSKEEESSKEEVSSEEVESSEEASSEEVESSEEVSSEEVESSEEAESSEEESSEEVEEHECDLTAAILSKEAASCKEGYIQYGCTCGALGEKVVIAATGEHVLTWIAEKLPTCTENGHPAYSGCLNCDYNAPVFEAPVAPVKPAMADFVAFGELAESMYNKAIDEYNVALGKYEEALTKYEANVEKYTAIGHHYSEAGKVEATCTEDGYTYSKYCADCLVEYISENIEAFEEIETDAEAMALFNASGLITFKAIPATGHDLGDTYVPGKAPTCTEDGFEATYECANCDYAANGAVINALDHNVVFDAKAEGYVGSTAATCTAEAYCGVCKVSYGEKAAHDFKAATEANKAATCTEIGWTNLSYCADCKAVDAENTVYVPANGHDWKDVAAKAATCTEFGWKAYAYCEDCNEIATKSGTKYTIANVNNIAIKAKGHTISTTSEGYAKAVAATCTTEGKEVSGTCSVCEEAVVGATIDKLGHDYLITVYSVDEEGKLVSETQLEDNAAIVREVYEEGFMVEANGVIVWGYLLDDEDAMIPVYHKSSKAATCTKNAYCGYCASDIVVYDGDYMSKKEADAKIAAAKKAWEADETNEGEFEALPIETTAVAHYFKDVEAVVATCTTAGTLAHQKCMVCSALSYNDEIVKADFLAIAKQNHVWSEGDVVIDAKVATCTEIGWNAHHFCLQCGTKASDYKEIAIVKHSSSYYGACTEQVKCDHSYSIWTDANSNGVEDADEVVWYGCGELIDNTNVSNNHYYVDGICAACGNECAHNYNDKDVCIICKDKKDDIVG